MVKNIPRKRRFAVRSFGIFSVFNDERLSEDEIRSCNFDVRSLVRILIDKEKAYFHNKTTFNNKSPKVFVVPILPEHRKISVTRDYLERRAEACI